MKRLQLDQRRRVRNCIIALAAIILGANILFGL
jgi:hypothetical protein